MENKKNDLLAALLGAAILGSMNEETEPETEAQPEMTNEQAAARKTRKLYDAFVEEGFTDEQAVAFIVALMS